MLEFSPGDRIADQYEVVATVDESPLGVTLRVRHPSTGASHRLLVLRPGLQGDVPTLFERARAVRHPALLEPLAHGEHQGLRWIAYADFEGTTLRALLQESRAAGRAFALEEAAQIVTQILEGLHAAHGHGLVLRALRPEHVLVQVRHTGPRQKMLATVAIPGIGLWDLVPAAALAEEEYGRGEAQYLAPELKGFEPTPTPRTDVYSAGVVFYELLVGSPPIGTYEMPRATRPELPEHVDEVVELAIAPAPEDRYPSAADFVRDVQRTFQDAALLDTEPTKPLVGPIGWGLGLLTVAAVGVLAWSLKPDPVREALAADSALRARIVEAHARPPAEEIATLLQRHPKNMVYVPPGPFVRGRLRAESPDVVRPGEPLAEEAHVEGFLIDIFEYPNLAQAAPRYGVTYLEAEKLCAEQGKRLCTELEWEKACKGPGNFVYAFGDEWSPEPCGNGLDDISRSGTREACVSGWRVFDMSGNFREWTATPYRGNDQRRIVKGGLKGDPQKGARCAASNDASVAFKDPSLSFRCCRDVDAPPFAPADAATGAAAGAPATGATP